MATVGGITVVVKVGAYVDRLHLSYKHKSYGIEQLVNVHVSANEDRHTSTRGNQASRKRDINNFTRCRTAAGGDHGRGAPPPCFAGDVAAVGNQQKAAPRGASVSSPARGASSTGRARRRSSCGARRLQRLPPAPPSRKPVPPAIAESRTNARAHLIPTHDGHFLVQAHAQLCMGVGGLLRP